MSNRVLPALLVLLKIRELCGDVGVDLAQGGPLLRTVLNRHGNQSDVTEGRLAVRGGSAAPAAAVSAIGTVTGSNGDRGVVRTGGGRGGRGRCGRIAVGGAVKGAYRRRTLVVQMMMRRTASGSGGGGVHGDHGIWTVQAVMGMMMMVVTQRDMVRRGQAATQVAAGHRRGFEVLRRAADTAARQLRHEAAY